MASVESKLRLDREFAYRKITPEMIEREKARIGVPVKVRTPHIEAATKDAIRHWARGIGDPNPLWTDEEYARNTRYGVIIAPPTIVSAMEHTTSTPLGFPGIHGWHMGCSAEWFDVIRRDVAVDRAVTLHSLEEKRSRYAGGTAWIQTYRVIISDRATGAKLCQWDNPVQRFERESGRAAAKYSRSKEVYTNEQLERIVADYDREVIRGATPRYWEDVAVGDEVPHVVKGPLTITDCIAFVVGWGGTFVYAHRFAWDLVRNHPGSLPQNESNIPDAPERTHWVDQFAQSIGAPAAFDYGPQRIGWFGHCVTNWMGDDGFMRRLQVRIERPNYHGDTTWVRGRVTEKDAESSEVTLSLVAVNQLDEQIASAQSIVRLERRPKSAGA